MKKPPGKAKAKYNAHCMVWKTVPSENVVLSETGETVENLVTLEASRPLSKPAVRGNSVLSGSKQSTASLQNTCNVFSCNLIHNIRDGTLDQCQTDTDPSGHLCILMKARTTSWTHYIRVKVDPGTDTNHMPLHHFRTIFPYLCNSSGQPKEGVLEKAESSFESYSGDNITVIGQTKL